MYKVVETSPQIEMSNSRCLMYPIKTLKDEFGGVCQIIMDDNCLVICLMQKDGTFLPSTHIFCEVFEVLKSM